MQHKNIHKKKIFLAILLPHAIISKYIKIKSI